MSAQDHADAHLNVDVAQPKQPLQSQPGCCGSLPLIVDWLKTQMETYGPHSAGRSSSSKRTRFGQQRIEGPAPWGLVCRSALKVLSVYPTGITEAVLVSELQSELIASQTNKQDTIKAIMDKGAVDYATILDVLVTSTRKVEGGAAIIATLGDWDKGTSAQQLASKSIEMYLHYRFEHLVATPLLPDFSSGDISAVHSSCKLRMSGVRIVQQPGGGLRLLPTEFILPIVDTKDKESQAVKWVLDEFSLDGLLKICPGEDIFVLAKVLEIGSVQRVNVMNRTERLSVVLTDLTDNSASTRELVLWDEQTIIASMLHRGDIVMLARPFIPDKKDENGRYWLEYGSATVIGLVELADVEAISQSLSQKLTGTQLPLLSEDYERHIERVMIRDLDEHISHVSLIASVILVSPNIPHTSESGSRQNILKLCVGDETGRIDVTVKGLYRSPGSSGLLDPLLIQCARLRVGQVLLIRGARCFRGINGNLSLECKASHRAEIIATSTLGIELHLREPEISTIHDAVTSQKRRFIIKAMVVEVYTIAPSFQGTEDVHCDCHYPANYSDDSWQCSFCRLNHIEIETQFRLQLVIDDGTLAINVDAVDHVLEMLCPTSAPDFRMGHVSDKRLQLSSIACQELLMDICLVTQVGSNCRYRIDAISRRR